MTDAETPVPVPMRLDHLSGVLDLGFRLFDVNTMPYTSWSLSSAATHLDTQPEACWVVEDGEAVAGFVLASMSYDERSDWGYVEWIGVAPEHRGRGVADALLERSCAALFAAGATRIVTDVERSNTACFRCFRPGPTVVPLCSGDSRTHCKSGIAGSPGLDACGIGQRKRPFRTQDLVPGVDIPEPATRSHPR